MDDIRHCIRCGGEFEMIIAIKELHACKDCKRIYADSGDSYYELVGARIDGTLRPVYWINGQLSLQGPVIFAYFTGIDDKQHYMAGPSMNALKELTEHINATPKERATLSVVDEAVVSKLNLRFFDQAKKEVLTYQRTYYLGTQ